jgi:Uma2 family endonuclease
MTFLDLAQHMITRADLFRRSPAEQIMVMPATQRRWTASEVRELVAQNPLWTPRYELVDGELLVTPSPAFVHARAVTALLEELLDYLRREPVGEVYPSPTDVELEPEFLSQPDVYVVRPSEVRRLLKDGLPIRELMLVIEVLSPSSVRHDRVRKRPMYQRHVPEYWIVDLEARSIARWRPVDQHPETLTQTLEWHPAESGEPFRLDVRGFFARVFDDPEASL